MVRTKIIKGGTLEDLGIMIQEYGNILERIAKDDGVYDKKEEEAFKYPRVIIGDDTSIDYGEIGRKAWVPPGHSLPLIIGDILGVTFEGNGEKGKGKIRAYEAPNNTIALDAYWNNKHTHLDEIYQLIENRIKQQGWDDVVEGEAGSENGNEMNREEWLGFERKTSGRKPYKPYDEAYEKLQRGGIMSDVYQWYCKEVGISKPRQYDRNAFDQAMRRRREKIRNIT